MATKGDTNKAVECKCTVCTIVDGMPDEMTTHEIAKLIAQVMFTYGVRTEQDQAVVMDRAQAYYKALVGAFEDKPIADAGPGVKVMEFSSIEEMLAYIKQEDGVSESTLDELRRLADEDEKKQAEPTTEELIELASLLGGVSLASRMRAHLESKKRAN